ncbi:hypothetical protein [Leifsonia sp. RAF41]|uniref:hypothetical protein n=1 Tax=Leifsonia sp. RAF41 TaxID=3233056 RepID=UPI003F96AC70
MALVLVGAVVFGVLSSLSNGGSSGFTYVLNSGWSWAAVMMLAGWVVHGGVVGALVSTAVGVCAAFVFYTCEILRLGTGADLIAALHDPSVLSRTAPWALIAVLLGPGLGVLGGLMRVPRVVGFLSMLIIPVGASLEMVWVPLWDVNAEGPQLLIAQVLTWVAALVVVVLATLRLVRDLRRPAPADRHGVRELLGVTRAARWFSAVAVAAAVVIGIGFGFYVQVANSHPWQAGLSTTQQSADGIIAGQVTGPHKPSDPTLTIQPGRTLFRTSDALPAGTQQVIIPQGRRTTFLPDVQYVMFIHKTAQGWSLIDARDAVYRVTDDGTLAPAISGSPLPAWVTTDLGVRPAS